MLPFPEQFLECPLQMINGVYKKNETYCSLLFHVTFLIRYNIINRQHQVTFTLKNSWDITIYKCSSQKNPKQNCKANIQRCGRIPVANEPWTNLADWLVTTLKLLCTLNSEYNILWKTLQGAVVQQHSWILRLEKFLGYILYVNILMH